MNIKLLITIFLFLLISSNLKSQVVNDAFSIEIFGGGALGSNYDTGIRTTENDKVKVSTAGGYSYSMRLGYCFKNYFETTLSVGNLQSDLLPKAENGEGSFKRIILQPLLSYKLKVNKKNYLNGGLGFRISVRNLLDIDISQLENGYHIIYSHYPSYGKLAFISYEGFLSENFSAHFSTSIFYNKYVVENADIDGITYVPTSTRYLNSSGMEFNLGIRYHFYRKSDASEIFYDK